MARERGLEFVMVGEGRPAVATIYPGVVVTQYAHDLYGIEVDGERIGVLWPNRKKEWQFGVAPMMERQHGGPLYRNDVPPPMPELDDAVRLAAFWYLYQREVMTYRDRRERERQGAANASYDDPAMQALRNGIAKAEAS